MGNRLHHEPTSIADILDDANTEEHYDPINTNFIATLYFRTYDSLKTALRQFLFLSGVSGQILKTKEPYNKKKTKFYTTLNINGTLPNMCNLAVRLYDSDRTRRAFAKICGFKNFGELEKGNPVIVEILKSEKSEHLQPEESKTQEIVIVQSSKSSGDIYSKMVEMSKSHIPSKENLVLIYLLDWYQDQQIDNGFAKYHPIPILMKHFYGNELNEIISLTKRSEVRNSELEQNIKKELEDMKIKIGEMATKKDLGEMATSLVEMATKKDLGEMATNMATKKDLEEMMKNLLDKLAPQKH